MNKIRAKRRRAGLTQAQVARAVVVNVRSVMRWELDQAAPRPRHRRRLARLFQCRPEDLSGAA